MDPIAYEGAIFLPLQKVQTGHRRLETEVNKLGSSLGVLGAEFEDLQRRKDREKHAAKLMKWLRMSFRIAGLPAG